MRRLRKVGEVGSLKVDKSWQRGWGGERDQLWQKLVGVKCARSLSSKLINKYAWESTVWRQYIQKILPFYKDYFWFISFLL